MKSQTESKPFYLRIIPTTLTAVSVFLNGAWHRQHRPGQSDGTGTFHQYRYHDS